VSRDEAHNGVVARAGTPRPSGAGLLHHHELRWMVDGYEPDRGVGVAGHRAYFLKGAGLLLNQALISYGLAFLAAREYTPLQPPFFMNREAMAGVAQLSDFDETLYKVEGADESGDKYLIATSEQPICAFHRGEWLAEKDLPKRYAGYSACFRKEAGSHGRDTWGIFRVHQFDKVEQFVVCEPEQSPAAHLAMVAAAEGFYQSLGLAYRVVNICSGELNNAAAIKYDLEGWFPTLANFRELVSTSNCTDYQSRAMEVRCGLNKKAGPAGEPTKKYVHFLNGTLVATTRTICAILENYQTADGVKIPDVLVPFMGGRTFIPFTREKPVNKQAEKGAGAGGGVAAGAAPAKAAP
jgi:seryl-tRNA synthetase